MPKNNAASLKPFDESEHLTDERTIAEYLNAAAEIGDPAVLLNAFAAVGRARGMTELASKAGLGRESLYKALAPGAHPRYDTIFKVAQALGVGFHFAAPEMQVKQKSGTRSRVKRPSAAGARGSTKKTTARARLGGQRAAAKP